jgi:hypothetical protein
MKKIENQVIDYDNLIVVKPSEVDWIKDYLSLREELNLFAKENVT